MNPKAKKYEPCEWLSHSWLPAALAILAIILTLPSITSGLGADDMTQREVLLDSDRDPWTDMFRFAGDEDLDAR